MGLRPDSSTPVSGIFEQVQNEIMPDPDVVKSNLNRPYHRTDSLIDVPSVSLDPSGIGGEYASVPEFPWFELQEPTS